MISDSLPNIKGLIIDMDGVLYRDTEPIGDLPAIFKKIRSYGLKFILATNNATRTVDEYIQKMRGLGVAVDEREIITAAQATGIYIQEHNPGGCRLFVVGQPSLIRTLEDYGLTVVSDPQDNVDVVVASLDLALSYDKIRDAELLIRDGCEFIGTNPDVTYPTPGGLYPGSGTVIGAIEIASGQKPTIIGKPQPLLYQMALRRLELKPEETLGIGDRLETDIAGAQAAGMPSALVLTGAATLAQAKAFSPPPDIIVQDLTELIF
ncbi:HAD-IIA family hydrolase [bacterium]|nr:HAD-IIA family hydrolase [bacterium]